MPHLEGPRPLLARRSHEREGVWGCGAKRGRRGADRGPNHPRAGCKSTVYFACAQDNCRCRVEGVVTRYAQLTAFQTLLEVFK